MSKCLYCDNEAAPYDVCRECWDKVVAEVEKTINHLTLKESCKTCKFFFDKEKGYAEGICRRHAPITNVSFTSYINWPTVTDDDWCGDWEKNDRN